MSVVVILADDDSDDRSLFSEAITEADPSVIYWGAENGQAALNYLTDQKNLRPAIIFLDINMPVLNGWETLAEIKANKKLLDIPVVMYSTTSQSHHVQKALNMGALFFLTKPDSYSRIREILTIVIANLNLNLLDAVKKFPDVKWEVR